MIPVSGLLGIPQNDPKTPSLLSLQHGTIIGSEGAPSNYPNSQAESGLNLIASLGFVTIMPDYIGYGVSKNIMHPYFDKKYSAQSVVGMIKAVKEYLKKQEISVSGRLFLLGYSEGGYTTMAAQQAIETNPSYH